MKRSCKNIDTQEHDNHRRARLNDIVGQVPGVAKNKQL